MAHQWSDKVVLVTGAARGIGASLVEMLMDEGVKHVAILDVLEEAGVALQEDLNKKYGANKTKFHKCDVTDDDQLFGTFKSTLDQFGYIDVVVNNAGIMNDSKPVYRKAIAVNVTALVTGTMKALELMRKDEGNRGGTVINISSIAGLFQSSAMPIYNGAKSFVLQFSNCIGLEDYFAKTGVRVLTVCFGATQTPLIDPNNLAGFDKGVEKDLLKAINTQFPIQNPESAAAGVVDVYKRGESGSTWLISNSKPAEDITENVKTAYEHLSQARHHLDEPNCWLLQTWSTFTTVINPTLTG